MIKLPSSHDYHAAIYTLTLRVAHLCCVLLVLKIQSGNICSTGLVDQNVFLGSF